MWPSQNIWISIRRKKNYKDSRIRDAYLHKVSSLHLFTLRFFIKFCKLLSYQCNFFGHRFGFSKSILEIKTQNVKHLLTCCLRLSELLTDVNVFHSCWLGTIYVLRNEDLGFSEPPSPLRLLVLNKIQNCHFLTYLPPPPFCDYVIHGWSLTQLETRTHWLLHFAA